jgi:hypothetical protein
MEDSSLGFTCAGAATKQAKIQEIIIKSYCETERE